MSLHVLLRDHRAIRLSRGDVVFHIASGTVDNEFRCRRIAHVGIVADDVAAHSLGDEIRVFHMGMQYVQLDTWPGLGSQSSRVEAVGSLPHLDKYVRDDIVKEASRIYGRRSMLDRNTTCVGRYYIGAPRIDLDSHDSQSETPYKLSCATFAHEVYRIAIGTDLPPIVQTKKMPVAQDHDIKLAAKKLGNTSVPEESEPILFPAYLMWAFELEEFPFCPDDWERHRYTCTFIPPNVFEIGSHVLPCNRCMRSQLRGG